MEVFAVSFPETLVLEATLVEALILFNALADLLNEADTLPATVVLLLIPILIPS